MEAAWIWSLIRELGTSLVVQTVKSLPAVPETWVWFLGQKDPLKKGMATHASILAWKIPWMEEPGESMGWQRVEHNWVTSLFSFQETKNLLHGTVKKEKNFNKIFKNEGPSQNCFPLKKKKTFKLISLFDYYTLVRIYRW